MVYGYQAEVLDWPPLNHQYQDTLQTISSRLRGRYEARNYFTKVYASHFSEGKLRDPDDVEWHVALCSVRLEVLCRAE